MKTVESSAVFQPKQWAKKEAGKTIENRTQPELVPNQASKSNIVRGAHLNEPFNPADIPHHALAASGHSTLRDFVHAPFELLKVVGLKTSTHDAETVANPGADVTRARAI